MHTLSPFVVMIVLVLVPASYLISWLIRSRANRGQPGAGPAATAVDPKETQRRRIEESGHTR